jgi:PAS domain S-box-containing protein
MLDGFALHEIIRDDDGAPIDYRFLSVNPAFESQTGLKAGDLIGKTVLAVLPKLEKHWIETYGRIVLTGESIQFESYSAGLGRHFTVTAYSPAENQFACIFRDITEQKRVAASLLENKIILESFLEHSPVYIFFKDHEIRSLMLSRNYEQMLGMPLEDLLGKTMEELFPSALANKMIEDDKNIISGGETINIVEELGGKIYETTKFPIHIDGKPDMLAGFTVDITERKELEKQLRQAQKMEALGTMAGGIAHDFNNILAAVLGYADMAKEGIPVWSPAKQQIEEVLKAGNRAKELVKQILAFSRKADQSRVPLKIRLLIKEAVTFLRASIPSTIEIKLNVAPGCGHISADPTQIHQVIMNLCANAANAMEDRGGILSIDLGMVDLTENDLGHSSIHRPGSYILLSVEDTGTGIEKELLDRIFDPYFTTKDIGKGTGMGLAVVHGIVQSHGGLINVKSTPGQGTTFKLFFPMIQDEAEKQEVADTTPFPGGREKILVVDDDSNIAILTQRRLASLGYQATAKTSSPEALVIFQDDPNLFDLVITDQTMPNMTGEQLAGKLLEIRPDIPIIICTGYSSKMDAEKAKSIGVRAFMSKPYDNRELARTVRQVLDAS